MGNHPCIITVHHQTAQHGCTLCCFQVCSPSYNLNSIICTADAEQNACTVCVWLGKVLQRRANKQVSRTTYVPMQQRSFTALAKLMQPQILKQTCTSNCYHIGQRVRTT